MLHLHLICRIPKRFGWSRTETGTFRSRAWVLSQASADELVGGRVYLHGGQDQAAWHGGKVVGWRPDLIDPTRIEIEYVVDGDFRVACPSGWGMEMAFIRD